MEMLVELVWKISDVYFYEIIYFRCNFINVLSVIIYRIIIIAFTIYRIYYAVFSWLPCRPRTLPTTSASASSGLPYRPRILPTTLLLLYQYKINWIISVFVVTVVEIYWLIVLLLLLFIVCDIDVVLYYPVEY